MADRYHGHPHPGRSATFNNPATTSLPASIGYTSLYAGDMHVMPSSTRQQATTSAAPRGYVTTTSSGAPSNTTTRTYAVTQDPRSQRPTTRDVTRGHRSSTLDSATGRPPVIIMTTKQDRPNPVPSHTSTARSGSPIRDDYRASEGQFYTQPASSIRSRSNARPFSEHLTGDDYARSRDPSDSLAREADNYRSSRPSVTYPSNPRHSSSTIDYGDDGYQYTNAGDLVRYDLEHPQSFRSRRHESFDRGYRRPDINYTPDGRVLNVNTSPDQGRNYITTTRQLETRGGPPPTTRGFDKIPRGYDSTRDAPPAAPVPPDPTVSTLRPGVGTGEGRRPRPVSLYQESAPRSQHHDDYYRSRDDEKTVREQRDWELEPERSYGALTYDPQTYDSSQPGYFHDDRVTSRGFGIRTGEPVDEYDYRREPIRVEEPKKRSDEAISREPEPSREDRRRSRTDTKESSRRERRESKKDDDEKERSRFRDKISSGLGIAAAAVGITPSIKNDDKRSKDDSKGRRGSDEGRERRRDTDAREGRPSTREPARTKDYEREKSRDRSEVRDNSDSKQPSRRETSSRKNGDAVISGSDSDEVKKTKRRHRTSGAFNPNDATELAHLKEQLAAMKPSDAEKEKPVVIETARTRSPSPIKAPIKESKPTKDAKPRGDSTSPPVSKSRRDSSSPSDYRQDTSLSDENRGREVVVPTSDKSVRVVSPPRDKKDEKPLKGILKAPKVSFPEDPNPIREGVAPHKEDKKIKEAPPGAKWTKISRKIVNPEALTIGKERFEIRDDFVIVLRVLSKEEIQAYASATQVLRERRRQDDDSDDGRDDDDRRKHRHRRHRDDDDDRDRDRDRDRPRRRRHRDDDEYDNRSSKDQEHHHHHHHRY
ncbi:hypothetical protein B0T10DRAFT_398526 [Thelonectria olida]|uniref:DUF8035 domain-containing protein n=1 Tax=Thelonectria olida TaxID=1576542 RepID=A0A9P8W9H3_9HYPO|nr:hypothetical protein B0T10DRAFT_398526 [Thelonectria olida]